MVCTSQRNSRISHYTSKLSQYLPVIIEFLHGVFAWMRLFQPVYRDLDKEENVLQGLQKVLLQCNYNYRPISCSEISKRFKSLCYIYQKYYVLWMRVCVYASVDDCVYACVSASGVCVCVCARACVCFCVTTWAYLCSDY